MVFCKGEKHLVGLERAQYSTFSELPNKKFG